MSIDVNADAGESFGRWILGNDDELMKHVSSVNTACGFHGGDPGWMRNSVRLAMQHNVDLGAHPGFPDLLGFGRRSISATHDEIIDMSVYQVGALMGFATSEGTRLTHVKPHGSLNMTVNTDIDLLLRFADAMLGLQDDLDIVAFAGPAADALRDRGINVRAEIVADMEYDDEGMCIIERTPPWKDPEYVSGRALDLAKGVLKTLNGREIPIAADSLCIHGDRPNAVDIAIAVRQKLADSGIKVQAPSRRPAEDSRG